MRVISRDWAQNMVDKIKLTGFEARDGNGKMYYDAIGHMVEFLNLDISNIKMLCNDDGFYEEFYRSLISKERDKVCDGIYIMGQYLFLEDAIKSCFKHMVSDGINSRRFVVKFPVSHCFQSVQFIVRNNTLTVLANMRSCNAVKNLEHDALICAILASIFKAYYSFTTDGGKLNNCINMFMVFGSLHVYKDEV